MGLLPLIMRLEIAMTTACLVLFFAGCGEPEAEPLSYEGVVGQTIGEGAQIKERAVEKPEGAAYTLDDRLRINEIQLKGSHNSYHLRPDTDEQPQWQYDLPSLTRQLNDWGIRSVELDLHYFDGQFPVYHTTKINPNSTCPELGTCLAEVRKWSTANPGHQPLFIFLEFKDENDEEKIINHLEELEDALKRAWPDKDVIEPDQVVGDYDNVKSAAINGAWPTLGEARGKAFFIMLAFGDAPYKYAHNGSGLWGRRMFVTSTDGRWRHAGFVAMDAQLEQEHEIREAVEKGLIVRTRTDNLPGGGRDLWTKRDTAFRSGAQIVATDYPADDAIDNYSVNLPGGMPSRCNPLTGPLFCYAEAIENPLLLSNPSGTD